MLQPLIRLRRGRPTSRVVVAVRGFVVGLHGQWFAEGVAVGLEAPAVDVDEDRVADGHGHHLSCARAVDVAQLQALAAGGDDHMGVFFQLEVDRLIEFFDAVLEFARMLATREVPLLLGSSVDEHLHAIHVEPVGALHAHVQLDGAAAG